MNINEIITVDEIVQPDDNRKKHIANLATKIVPNFTNLYYNVVNNQLLVVAKNKNDIMGYAIGELASNDKSSEFATYMIPKNLYSWANDKGATALRIIKAMIQISHCPVLSDLRLSIRAKKFLRRKVEAGELNGEVFNLKTGQVTPYDPDIWVSDDDERILIMEHGGRNHLKPSLLMPTGTWNWRQLNKQNYSAIITDKYHYEHKRI